MALSEMFSIYRRTWASVPIYRPVIGCEMYLERGYNYGQGSSFDEGNLKGSIQLSHELETLPAGREMNASFRVDSGW